ncbi:putative F-box/FBD/LRR-repeat protein At4g13965 isoform X2 [Gastrolobium bilobum]|uniref:putative F-box/FBD/LRR-repeat protein At4g13965 isoform X2 n=1 Tax=Gastrolobium bilobum TaxID=150636 RepID=UPI002AB0D7CA|nr:putative F-box/FBD/LRR-repeat protein At4g13965 isoform X2 [Gastrolobium bilobum]
MASSTAVLEDLEAIRISFFGNSLPDGAFKRLSKLVRANIYAHHVPLEAVSNVEFLCINFSCIKVDNVCVPVFHNVTHIELAYTNDWLEVVIEVLKQCPKLQVLVIDENKVFQRRKDERGDWPYPQSVPESISLHLKACHLKNYKGWEGEFQFARYIMQNARHLRSMTFCFHTTTNEQAKNKMIDKLFLCTRLSGTCKLSFK